MLDSELFEMEIELDNLYKECYGNVLDGSTKINIINTLHKLKTKTIRVVNNQSEKGYENFEWLSHFKYDYETKKATIRLHDKLINYVVDLPNLFTKIDRDVYMSMDTPYGIRLMELMNRVYGEVIITRGFEIDELRKLLHVGNKYKRNYHFKTRVIDEAIKDVNKNNYKFNLKYEIIKEGRKLKKFKFVKYNIKE